VTQANGTAPPSIIRTLIEDPALPPEQLELIKGLMATMYLAGSDTTIAVVVSFFLAMVVYPGVQAKAQAEIDSVVGKDRLPEMDDAPRLPYIQGVVNECYRWLTVAPMGPPLFPLRPRRVSNALTLLSRRSACHHSRRGIQGLLHS
jgi:cytochrome P450